jgi:hypothetical protein
LEPPQNSAIAESRVALVTSREASSYQIDVDHSITA